MFGVRKPAERADRGTVPLDPWNSPARRPYESGLPAAASMIARRNARVAGERPRASSASRRRSGRAQISSASPCRPYAASERIRARWTGSVSGSMPKTRWQTASATTQSHRATAPSVTNSAMRRKRPCRPSRCSNTADPPSLAGRKWPRYLRQHRPSTRRTRQSRARRRFPAPVSGNARRPCRREIEDLAKMQRLQFVPGHAKPYRHARHRSKTVPEQP